MLESNPEFLAPVACAPDSPWRDSGVPGGREVRASWLLLEDTAQG
jgi:hypothetical protein